MKSEICLKVKEIGEIQGIFVNADKEYLHLKNAVFNKVASTVISAIQIEKKYIISVARVSEPIIEEFTNEQLEIISKMADCKYSEKAISILQSRKDISEKLPILEVPNDEVKQTISEDTSNIYKPNFSNISKIRKPKGEWNQFEENDKLFGVKADFDMSEYSTPIDVNDKDYSKNLERSRKIANEILSQKTDDMHILEERGIAKNKMVNDELLYTAVQTDKNKGWGVNNEDSAKGDSVDMSKLDINNSKDSSNSKVSNKVETKAVDSKKSSNEKAEVKNVDKIFITENEPIQEKIEKLVRKDENLIKEEKKVLENVGKDPAAMWSNITNFLTTKNMLESKLSAKVEKAAKSEIKSEPKSSIKVETKNSLKANSFRSSPSNERPVKILEEDRNKLPVKGVFKNENNEFKGEGRNDYSKNGYKQHYKDEYNKHRGVRRNDGNGYQKQQTPKIELQIQMLCLKAPSN